MGSAWPCLADANGDSGLALGGLRLKPWLPPTNVGSRYKVEQHLCRIRSQPEGLVV